MLVKPAELTPEVAFNLNMEGLFYRFVVPRGLPVPVVAALESAAYEVLRAAQTPKTFRDSSALTRYMATLWAVDPSAVL